MDFSVMKLSMFAPLLLLSAIGYVPPARVDRPALDPLPPLISAPPRSHSYDETVGMLKDWLRSDGNSRLVPLFAYGDARSSDLLNACRTESDETANSAFMTLQLLGSSECQPCADSFSQKHGGPLLACAPHLGEAGFQRIDRWWSGYRTRKGYRCGKEEGWRIDDALVYALILDGSPRALATLNRSLALQKTCGEYVTIERETLERAPELVREAKQVGHDLKIGPDRVEESVRRSAFFLSREQRKHSKVNVLARNSTDTKMLVEVSYSCGKSCGRGYLVVLEKDGDVWQYALVRTAWVT
jgi:hypothetical protein